MDFKRCYERIWRAGLLHKTSGTGIVGRMWLYLKNFLTDRKYYTQVYNYKSQLYQSAVGKPQGLFISPVLSYLYSSYSMAGLRSNHAEYADDSSVWTSDKSIKLAAGVVSKDPVTTKYCGRWNRLIAADKTQVLMFPWDGRPTDEDAVVEYGGWTAQSHRF